MTSPSGPAEPKGKISFEPVESSAEAHRIIQDCARGTALSQLFTRKQKLVLTCRFVRINEQEREVGFRPDHTTEMKGFMEELASTKTSDCFANLVNDRVKVFFKSKIRGYRNGILFLEFPTDLFRVQRRQFLRYKIPLGHTLRVDISMPLSPDKVLHNKVLDISAGGLAFHVKANQKDDFISGMVIPGLRFTVNRRAIWCKAAIRHARPATVDGEEVLVIGALFQDLREEDREWISQYVREQTKHLLAKML